MGVCVCVCVCFGVVGFNGLAGIWAFGLGCRVLGQKAQRQNVYDMSSAIVLFDAAPHASCFDWKQIRYLGSSLLEG